MANIDIRRFVDIDILHHTGSHVDSTRDTVVLLTNESTLDQNTYEEYDSITEYMAGQFYSNGAGADSNTYKYVATYDQNGGAKIRVVKIGNYSDSSTFASNMKTLIDGLDNKFIVYACTDNDNTKMIALASLLNSDGEHYGIKQKIILARAPINSVPENINEINNLAIKCSSQIGAEMTIAAYLSKINVYESGSIQDYAFTRESSWSSSSRLDEDINDAQFEEITSSNCNVDIYLGGTVRNCGGNLTNGLDLVNQYTLIILHQTLTERILNILATKVRGQSGLDAIQTVMNNELNKYVDNGYLSTNKIWTEETIKKQYNGSSYTIIEQNTVLPLGYKITIYRLNH